MPYNLDPQQLGSEAGNVVSNVMDYKYQKQKKELELEKNKKELQDLLNPPTFGQEFKAPAANTPEIEAALRDQFQKENQRRILSGQQNVPFVPGSGNVPEPASFTAPNPRAAFAKGLGISEQQLDIPTNQVANLEKLQQANYYGGRNAAAGTKAEAGKIWYNPHDYTYSQTSRGPDDILVKNETAATQASYPQRQDIQQENALGRIGAQDDLREKRAVLQQRYQMRNDPQIKKLNDQGIGLDQVDSVLQLAQQGNTVAGSALGVKMAKAMGEVGVLTEQDVNRYITSGQLGQHAADVLSKWATGVPTDATLNDISQITGVMKDSYNKMTQPITNGYVESLARNYGMDPERAAYLLSVNYAPTQAQQPQHPQTPTQPSAPAAVPSVGGSFNGEKVRKVTKVQ